MGRSAWQKHKQKHKELVVSGCHYCEHPPEVPGMNYTRLSSRGIKRNKRFYKEMHEGLLKVLTSPQQDLITPATVEDMARLTQGGA